MQKVLPTGWLPKQFSPNKQLQVVREHFDNVKKDNNPRLLDSLQQILTFYFGAPESSPGILDRFGRQFANYEPLEWASQLQGLMEGILPASAAFGQMLRISRDTNARIVLPSAYLPQYVDINSQDKFRIVGSGFSVMPLDAFYLLLAYAIYSSETIAPPVTQFDHLFLDQFFSSLSRNPLLVVLRKNLQYFSVRDKQMCKKIAFYLRLYLMDELLIKYEQDRTKAPNPNTSASHNTSQQSARTARRPLQLKYRLKAHHMHALYLLLKYTPESISNDFSKYCQGVFEYFGVLRGDQFCLQAAVRLWIYGMGLRGDRNIENQVLGMLQQANSREGCFYLKRYSPTSVTSPDSLSLYNTQSALTLLKLLQKQSNWTPNASYLYTLACLFQFLNQCRIYYPEFVSCSRGEAKEAGALEKIFRLIVVRYNQNLVDLLSKIQKREGQDYRQAKQIIDVYQDIIQDYLSKYFQSKQQKTPSISSLREPQQLVPPDFKFRQITESDLVLSQENATLATSDPVDRITTENKRNLVNFYRRNPKSCWEIPIQYNQSSLLYFLWFAVAKLVDFFIPGRGREYPCVNLRFLANPITFLAVLGLVIVLHLIFR